MLYPWFSTKHKGVTSVVSETSQKDIGSGTASCLLSVQGKQVSMRVYSVAVWVLCTSSTVAFAPFGVNTSSKHHVSTLQSSPTTPENEENQAASLEMKETVPQAEQVDQTAPEPPQVKPAEPPKPAAKIGYPPDQARIRSAADLLADPNATSKPGHASDQDRIRRTMNAATPEKKPLQVRPTTSSSEGNQPIMFRAF